MNPTHFQWAFLCGCTAFIPIPFLDEYVERRVTRALLRKVAADRGAVIHEQALLVLTEDRSSVALGCLYTMVVWPLKKLFRTVFYFLTVKDVIDGTTLAAHRAMLVDIALAEGVLPGDAAAVRKVMDELLDKVRYSPVTRPLYRQERPELPGEPGQGFVAGLVRTLQRQGGGGLLVPLFHERLARLRAGS